ncbi:MAG: hypothetical protein PHS82_10940 [Lachnospiraceae bacterium]|nr:hypothetical protein [Lachnospiraceae bacterium]
MERFYELSIKLNKSRNWVKRFLGELGVRISEAYAARLEKKAEVHKTIPPEDARTPEDMLHEIKKKLPPL